MVLGQVAIGSGSIHALTFRERGSIVLRLPGYVKRTKETVFMLLCALIYTKL